ncbi:uncharacterized protein [Nicotiana tomentosiformis]|uniref:uncharacterized protein n=1 Tax=Nicotiana tomentosiformis TaxID=4098 RepID=UPI00388CC9D5
MATTTPEPRPVAAADPQKLLDRWTRLHPPIFGGERHEDPQDIIDWCKDRLYNMRILESQGVDFSYFSARGQSAYIPPSQREELRFQFEQLQQGQMLVTDYGARFSKLSRHALMILPTEAERMQRFVVGLHTGIQDTMAREVEMGTSYEIVVEIARMIEGLHQRSREQVTRDKRFRYSGEFRGAPSGGRGQFVRGQSISPPYPAPPPPRGAPV